MTKTIGGDAKASDHMLIPNVTELLQPGPEILLLCFNQG